MFKVQIHLKDLPKNTLVKNLKGKIVTNESRSKRGIFDSISSNGILVLDRDCKEITELFYATITLEFENIFKILDYAYDNNLDIDMINLKKK